LFVVPGSCGLANRISGDHVACSYARKAAVLFGMTC